MQQFIVMFTVMVITSFYSAAAHGQTLEKIDKSGTLVIGTRTGSPPFAYVNQKNEWVGFPSISSNRPSPRRCQRTQQVHQGREKGIGSATRIPLLTSNAVDLIAETMTDTQSRRDNVDFGITFFVTGAQFLVRKAVRSKAFNNRRKRIAAQQGSTNAKSSASACPAPSWWSFPTSQPPSKRGPRQVEAYRMTASNWPGSGPKRPSRTNGPWSWDFSPTNPTVWRCVKRFRFSPGRQCRFDGRNRLGLISISTKMVRRQSRSALPASPETKRFLQMQVVPNSRQRH